MSAVKKDRGHLRQAGRQAGVSTYLLVVLLVLCDGRLDGLDLLRHRVRLEGRLLPQVSQLLVKPEKRQTNKKKSVCDGSRWGRRGRVSA